MSDTLELNHLFDAKKCFQFKNINGLIAIPIKQLLTHGNWFHKFLFRIYMAFFIYMVEDNVYTALCFVCRSLIFDAHLYIALQRKHSQQKMGHPSLKF